MLQIELLTPLNGNAIAERLNRYKESSTKVEVRITTFEHTIAWGYDPNLDGISQAEIKKTTAVIMRVPIRYSFPEIINGFLPARLKRPHGLVARFGLWPSKEYKTLYTEVRADYAHYNNEEYIKDNSIFAQRFYPRVEEYIKNALLL